MPSERRAASATASAPRRDLMKARVGTFSPTSRASRSAACAVAVRRSLAPASPRASVSGGSHSAKASGPRGEPSSVTSSAASPVSSRAHVPGVPTVAEASMNTGRGGPPGGAWCATTRRSRRSTCPTCEPNTPRYPWHSSMIT